MSDYMTVKQFAAAAGVSQQAIYQRLNTKLKPFVSVENGKKMLSAEGLKLFEIQPLEQDLNKSLQALEQDLESLQAENETLKAENTTLNDKIKDLNKSLKDLEQDLEKEKAENTKLNGKIQALEQDLNKSLQALENSKKATEQTALIDELRADKDKLNARLDKAEEERAELIKSNNNLTTALQAAQALHGMDKQQTVIDVKPPPPARPAAANAESRPTSEPRPAQRHRSERQPQQKKTLFERLFGRS